MKMRELFKKLRDRSQSKPRARDWTSEFSPRDWADLPVYHPRREDDAL